MNNDDLNNLWNSMQVPDFFSEGACKNEDPKMWDDEDDALAFTAKRICSECPVKDLCATWGIANEPSGIWGGLDSKAIAKARRGKGKFITMEQRREDAEWYEDVMSTKPAHVIADKYGVAERTVYRWRVSVTGVA